GDQKKAHQVLVGFALETENDTANAQKKIKDKNADMIILNSLNDVGAGFKSDTNKITIYYKDGRTQIFDTKHKSLVAKDIVDSITGLFQ
ncbi:MAG TPA: phosphopantothenoylcysteine decarboxylase, partial [Chitinophagaceae bacterium]